VDQRPKAKSRRLKAEGRRSKRAGRKTCKEKKSKSEGGKKKEINFGPTGMAGNGEVRFWLDWNGLKLRKLFLA
jgi:hypothetical protein